MYEFEWVCRWDHVDPAQRAYFARLTQACHQAGEQFMVDAGWPYWDNPTEHGFVLPVVESGYQFERPIRVGERIAIAVEVEMGESSVRLEFTGRNEDGETAFTGFEQHVCVPTDENESVPLPEGFRRAVEEFQGDA